MVFSDFFGGMPGGRSGPVDNKTFYERLGVSQNASTAEIRKAFKKSAMVNHPDKGGDEEAFKLLCQAHEVLSDDEKRRIYDEYGEEGLQDGGSGSSAADIFSMFGGRGGRRTPTSKSQEQHLAFTLTEFAKGTTKRLQLTRRTICRACDGNGAPSDVNTDCSSCHGQGAVIQTVRMGPVIQQMTAPCGPCKGTGRIIPAGRACKTCRGERYSREKEQVTAELPAGAPNGYRIVLSGKSDDLIGGVAGDVILICNQKPDPVFERNGKDLFTIKGITVKEAICGVAFEMTDILGENFYVKVDSTLQFQNYLRVLDRGMPCANRTGIRGDLYIKLRVSMPEVITDSIRNSLNSLLPGNDARAFIPSPSSVRANTRFVQDLPKQSGEEHQQHYQESAGQPGEVNCQSA